MFRHIKVMGASKDRYIPIIHEIYVFLMNHHSTDFWMLVLKL